ncbi:MAG: hypothetical protein ACRER2_11910 [Methylococcales bacterium]
MNKFALAILATVLLSPAQSDAIDCAVFQEAIESCAAKDGCDTTVDDFADCLVTEQGISEQAEDGTNAVEEVVQCFQTEYQCEEGME